MKTILVRYGEIALKGHAVRRRFEDKLINNMTHALPFKHDISSERGRIFISTDKAEEAIGRLGKVFGIVSLSSCEVVESDLDAICKKASCVAGKHLNSGDTFALRVRRSGEHSFASRDVAVRCGDEIRGAMQVTVDLSNPAKEIFIEVRQERTYIYTEVHQGFGGLPLGTQGAAVSLLSGGIDSPVATFLAMKRGCKIFPVYLDLRPFVEEGAWNRFLRVAGKLKEYSIGEEFVPIVFPYGKAWKDIIEDVPSRLRCIFCKRGMLKLAELSALENGCDAIVTGENLGQVASQTLSNLRATSYELKMPVLRPLLTYDKNEIVEIAKEISTYSLSIEEPLSCTLRPSRPSTSSDLEEVLEIEEEMGFEEFIKRIYEERKEIELPV